MCQFLREDFFFDRKKSCIEVLCFCKLFIFLFNYQIIFELSLVLIEFFVLEFVYELVKKDDDVKFDFG